MQLQSRLECGAKHQVCFVNIIIIISVLCCRFIDNSGVIAHITCDGFLMISHWRPKWRTNIISRYQKVTMGPYTLPHQSSFTWFVACALFPTVLYSDTQNYTTPLTIPRICLLTELSSVKIPPYLCPGRTGGYSPPTLTGADHHWTIPF